MMVNKCKGHSRSSELEPLRVACLVAGGSFLPPRRLQDALVDEFGTLVARHGLDDGHDFLRCIEEASLCVLLLSSAAFAVSAPAGIFLLVLFHVSLLFSTFAVENPKVGGFPLPVGCQIQISNLILTFQTLTEIASFIRLSGFRFSYSFQGFRTPLCQSLIDTTKVRKLFENTKYFQDYFKGKCRFFPNPYMAII